MESQREKVWEAALPTNGKQTNPTDGENHSNSFQLNLKN